MSVCFFLQAEEGIRYDLVTGVQTCALPIFGGTFVSVGCRRRIPYCRADRRPPPTRWIKTVQIGKWREMPAGHCSMKVLYSSRLSSRESRYSPTHSVTSMARQKP